MSLAISGKSILRFFWSFLLKIPQMTSSSGQVVLVRCRVFQQFLNLRNFFTKEFREIVKEQSKLEQILAQVQNEIFWAKYPQKFFNPLSDKWSIKMLLCFICLTGAVNILNSKLVLKKRVKIWIFIVLPGSVSKRLTKEN